MSICFFSSRRRHTRFDCDWSSDVCSSDLQKKRKPDSLKEAPSDPEGVQRPSEGGAGEEFSRRRRGGYNPPTSTKICYARARAPRARVRRSGVRIFSPCFRAPLTALLRQTEARTPR